MRPLPLDPIIGLEGSRGFRELRDSLAALLSFMCRRLRAGLCREHGHAMPRAGDGLKALQPRARNLHHIDAFGIGLGKQLFRTPRSFDVPRCINGDVYRIVQSAFWARVHVGILA